MLGLTPVVLTLLLSFLAAPPARADDALMDIHHRLAAHAQVCADFTQQKILKALDRPLVSHGRLVFLSKKGVLWQVQDPFPAKFLIRQDALIRWDESGTPQRLGYSSLPVFRSLSQVFLAVFASKLDRLSEAFDVTAKTAETKWQMTLSPRDPIVRSVIEKLTLFGHRYIERLEIDESRGDRTQIAFQNIQSQNCQLTQEEKAGFAQ